VDWHDGVGLVCAFGSAFLLAVYMILVKKTGYFLLEQQVRPLLAHVFLYKCLQAWCSCAPLFSLKKKEGLRPAGATGEAGKECMLR